MKQHTIHSRAFNERGKKLALTNRSFIQNNVLFQRIIHSNYSISSKAIQQSVHTRIEADNICHAVFYLEFNPRCQNTLSKRKVFEGGRFGEDLCNEGERVKKRARMSHRKSIWPEKRAQISHDMVALSFWAVSTLQEKPTKTSSIRNRKPNNEWFKELRQKRNEKDLTTFAREKHASEYGRKRSPCDRPSAVLARESVDRNKPTEEQKREIQHLQSINHK